MNFNTRLFKDGLRRMDSSFVRFVLFVLEK
jgi:hypothetical protein